MTSSLYLRPATAADAKAVARLAALDETETPRGPVLMAFADGRPVAALSMADGRVAADPFARTAEAVELLAVRARRERRSAAPRRGRRLGRRGRLALA